MAQQLIEPTLLFDFSIVLNSVDRKRVLDSKRVRPKSKAVESSPQKGPLPFDWDLSQSHQLPQFASLAKRATHSQVWAGWAKDGMYFKMKISGKSSPPRFYGNTGGASDGLRIWIDTRSSPGIHRATRFCHCFHFFPGEPQGISDAIPHANLDAISRCRESPNAISLEKLCVASRFHDDGYTMWCHIPADCLTGFAPEEFDTISLFIDVVDFELGTQSISLGPELRYVEDPSLWIRADLQKA